MSDREEVRQYCEMSSHHWRDEYYGYQCETCGEFILYGCEPWMPLDDDDGEPDFTLDDLEWEETYPELCWEDDDETEI